MRHAIAAALILAGLVLAAPLAAQTQPAAAKPEPAPAQPQPAKEQAKPRPEAGQPQPPQGQVKAQPAPAAGPKAQEGLRRQVSGAQVLSATSTCFYGPHMDQPQAKRLCGYQTRAKILDKAVGALAANPAVAQAGLTPTDLRAFADSLLKTSVAEEEIRTVPDGLAVRLTLRAESEPGDLNQRLADFAGNPDLRAAALAETATRDRQAGEARMAAIPFGADREFRAKEIQNDMSEDAAFADRSIVPGMSMVQVKELLGDPGALKQALIGPESYVCAGYGKIWVVFRDGLVSCLRTRLDYVARYETDCHCAGNYATILKND